MKFSTIFFITGIIALFFGLLAVLFPAGFYAFYGGELSNSGKYAAQLQGAAYLGYAMLLFFASRAKELIAQRAISIGLFTSFIVGLIVALKGQLMGITNVWGWSTVALFFVLALIYLLLSMKKK